MGLDESVRRHHSSAGVKEHVETAVSYAKKVGIIAGAAIAVMTVLSALNAAVITRPIQNAVRDAMQSAVDSTQAEFWKLRRTVIAQSMVSATTDSILFIRLAQIESAVGERYYSRQEVDQIAKRILARQDSLLRYARTGKR